MKKVIICSIAACLLALVSCQKQIKVTDPITVQSPTPTEQITKVSLTDTEQGYMAAGNAMAFRVMDKVYDGNNLIISPLSLQYALAMTANGASGETLQEIIDFLGYGEEGIDALNAYSRKLLEQLPAVDLSVNLKLTDAILVNDRFPLLPAFKETVESNYYAAVESMPFTNPDYTAARINEWASRSTNGFIDKVLNADELSADAVAYLMNALYFKAKWAGHYTPMFREHATYPEDFTLTDGSKKKVDMMHNVNENRYAIRDGYKVLALPYANYKYYMYILLPDGNDVKPLLEKLAVTPWGEITGSLQGGARITLKLPKFEIENKFHLKETLDALGVKKAFKGGEAQFDRMFSPKPGYVYWIEKVIQKARIKVSEWGTEAAAVTVVEVCAESAGEPKEPKRINFFADHPFVYVIGEATSGAILFEGVYSGK
ncbi:MAG: serpin family protein [Bacteroidales bacterium]|nr:serpin family protein [Bacteroidales bacterium]